MQRAKRSHGAPTRQQRNYKKTGKAIFENNNNNDLNLFRDRQSLMSSNYRINLAMLTKTHF